MRLHNTDGVGRFGSVRSAHKLQPCLCVAWNRKKSVAQSEREERGRERERQVGRTKESREREGGRESARAEPTDFH